MDKSDESNLSRIPVFVFPATVYFNAHDRDHLKQILTIYNPYEFPVRFKVLSTSPNLYTVIDPEGSIKSKNCVDLILRVSSDVPFDGPNVLEHKFRVQIYHYHERKLLGKRDVVSIIHFGNLPPHLAVGSDASSSGGALSDAFQQLTSGTSGGSSSSGSGSKEHPISSSNVGGSSVGIGFLPQTTQPNYVVILTALVCIVGLMLPTSGENCNNPSTGATAPSTQSSSFIPIYLHLTVNQKLLFAYALGLVTMVIFRP